MEGTQSSSRGNGDRRGCHRDVIGRFPQVICVVIAEGIPETVQLSANRLDVLLSCNSAVLRIFDKLRPRFWRVTEPGQIEWHWPFFLFEWVPVELALFLRGRLLRCFGRRNLVLR